jgi:hypothetical protein
VLTTKSLRFEVNVPNNSLAQLYLQASPPTTSGRQRSVFPALAQCKVLFAMAQR